MAVEERERIQLHRRLEQALGAESAVTMMTLLPPTGWADVATRTDLISLEQRLEQRFEQRFQRMDDRFAALEHRIDDRYDALRHELVAVFRGELVAAVSGQTRALIFSMVATVLSLGGLALALARLA